MSSTLSEIQIKLCDPGCNLWHSKHFFMLQWGISERTLYRWIDDGLRISRKGMIWCPWAQEYYGREWQNGSGDGAH